MSDLQMIGHLDIKGHDAIKRVYSPEGIAPTLTTCGGGMREVKILDMERFRVRKLTPTEYGRLQAFPMQDWKQVVSDSQAYKQFGNAVTTTVVTAVAESIKAALDAGMSRPAEERQTKTEETPIKLAAFSTEQLLQELMRRQAQA